jgi:hypothetical protein
LGRSLTLVKTTIITQITVTTEQILHLLTKIPIPSYHTPLMTIVSLNAHRQPLLLKKKILVLHMMACQSHVRLFITKMKNGNGEHMKKLTKDSEKDEDHSERGTYPVI